MKSEIHSKVTSSSDSLRCDGPFASIQSWANGKVDTRTRSAGFACNVRKTGQSGAKGATKTESQWLGSSIACCCYTLASMAISGSESPWFAEGGVGRSTVEIPLSISRTDSCGAVGTGVMPRVLLPTFCSRILSKLR